LSRRRRFLKRKSGSIGSETKYWLKEGYLTRQIAPRR
jgi:hypothetical protein